MFGIGAALGPALGSFIPTDCGGGLGALAQYGPVLNLFDKTIEQACSMTLGEFGATVRETLASRGYTSQWAVPAGFSENDTLADACAVTCQLEGVVSRGCTPSLAVTLT